MKNIKFFLGFVLFLQLFLVVSSCKKPKIEQFTYDKNSPSVELTTVPYPKLSDYNFFRKEMKYQIPVVGVVAYAPTTPLFTDYALKKRFIWMMPGTSANYVNDTSLLDFPNGTVFIKNFY